MENLADIVGAGATVPLSDTNILARWVQIVISGAGTVRYGGANVTAALGIPVSAGQSAFLPYDSALQCYSLRGLYAYIPVGATVSVGYEPFA